MVSRAGTALDLDEEFKAKSDHAAQPPKLYMPGRVKGAREIVVRPNYVMVYRVEEAGDTISVLRVLHAAQKWPPAEVFLAHVGKPEKPPFRRARVD